MSSRQNIVVLDDLDADLASLAIAVATGASPAPVSTPAPAPPTDLLPPSVDMLSVLEASLGGTELSPLVSVLANLAFVASKILSLIIILLL